MTNYDLTNYNINMGNYKVCSVFGHRDICDDKKNLTFQIKKELLNMILNENTRYFLFGGFGEFDDLCYEIVSQLKKSYPYINRIYCVENERLLRKDKQPNWLKHQDYEDIIYLEPEFKYWYKQIYFRNIEMMKISDYVLLYVRKEESNAYKLYCAAKKLRKTIIKV